MPPATIPPFGWRVPEPADAPDGPQGFRELAEDVAVDMAERTAYLGEVRMFANATLVPDGWVACNGSAIPAQYAALIAAIGPNTPNLTDRVPMGGGTALATGGSDHIATSQLPSHAHTINHGHTGGVAATNGSHTHVLSMTNRVSNNNFPPQGEGSGGVDGQSSAPIAAGGAHSHTVTIPTQAMNSGNTGGAGIFQPKFLRLVFAICAGPTAVAA